jgi:N-acetylglucosamine-6-phosphate deacetylase
VSTSLKGWDPTRGAVVEVRWRGDTISEVEPLSEHTAVPPDGEPVLSAGLVDLQVNGFRGLDLNAPEVSADTVVGMTEALAGVGVTTWVPTLVTNTEERIHHALGHVAAARAADSRVAAAVPFVHVEGPFISDQEGARGVHDPALVRPLDADEVARWLQGHDLVGMVTVSPHTADAPEQIRRIRTLGVGVSLGHTHATADQLRAAVDAGARLATHLGNGIPSQLPRHPNALWTLLAEDRVTAGVIADGHHLPAEVLTVMLRAKGVDRLFIVSDSTTLAGQPPGRYRTPVGGQVDVGADGRLSFVGTDLLAGAGVDLAHGLRHLVADLGLDWAPALALATATPARVVAQTRLGQVAGPGGGVRPGTRADLVLLAPDGPDRGAVETVVVGGVAVTSPG